MQTYPDKKLEEYIDSVLVIVAAAQEPDGYLYTARTMNPKHPHDWSGPERWSEVENLSHEFYNLGHMVEGAVAYYRYRQAELPGYSYPLYRLRMQEYR